MNFFCKEECPQNQEANELSDRLSVAFALSESFLMTPPYVVKDAAKKAWKAVYITTRGEELLPSEYEDSTTIREAQMVLESVNCMPVDIRLDRFSTNRQEVMAVSVWFVKRSDIDVEVYKRLAVEELKDAFLDVLS